MDDLAGRGVALLALLDLSKAEVGRNVLGLIRGAGRGPWYIRGRLGRMLGSLLLRGRDRALRETRLLVDSFCRRFLFLFESVGQGFIKYGKLLGKV